MVDFSKLAQVTDSFHKESNTTKSKIKDSAKLRFAIRKAIKDSAKLRFAIRKAIKDNEDKTIEQLQAILADNGYEVSAEELEAARQQFENDKIRDNEDANHQEASEGAPGNDVKHTTPSNDKEVEKPAGAGQTGGDSPIPDSLKKKVADALGETDSTEAAIKAALECINPDEGATAEAVLSAVTEVLSGTIDTLESQLPSVEEGSEENNPGNNPEVLGDSAKKKLSDSKHKSALRKRVKDSMEETTSTDEAIAAAISQIDEDTTPEEAMEVAIDIMSEIINELQSENDNGTSEEKPAGAGQAEGASTIPDSLDYLNKTIAPFEQSCCQQGIAMYYDYILKHADKVGNGFASLEQLEEVYSKIGGGNARELKKHADMFKDVIM